MQITIALCESSYCRIYQQKACVQTDGLLPLWKTEQHHLEGKAVNVIPRQHALSGAHQAILPQVRERVLREVCFVLLPHSPAPSKLHTFHLEDQMGWHTPLWQVVPHKASLRKGQLPLADARGLNVL